MVEELSSPAHFLENRESCAWIRDFVAHFANPVRIKILCRLMQGSACVTELVEATGERQPTISQQLKYLVLAGMVGRKGRGTRNYYRITDPAVPDTMRFLASVAQRAGHIPDASPSRRKTNRARHRTADTH